MHRNRLLVLVATLLLVTVAACGGAAPTPSPTPEPTEAPAPTDAPATEPPTEPAESESAPPAATTTAVAQCGGVALRKEPSVEGEAIVRVKAKTRVRVVETVSGDAYDAGSCGQSGDTWLKIDRVGGKSIQAQYGVPFAYVAAGFFR